MVKSCFPVFLAQKWPAVEFSFGVCLCTPNYRHELLRIPKKVDTDVPQGFVDHRQHVVVPEDQNWERQDEGFDEDEKDPGGW